MPLKLLAHHRLLTRIRSPGWAHCPYGLTRIRNVKATYNVNDTNFKPGQMSSSAGVPVA